MSVATFVERIFDLPGARVRAQFCQPVAVATAEFACHWRIVWPDREEAGRVFGEDGVQALMLALRRVSDVLMQSEPYKAGNLTLWGQRDLDLPPGWGAGPLYTIPHPPAS
ncbi:DUF6968 family protein [Frigidibacter mobilis]|uniref:DUF6968 domain-containing protein n=1 Tax=Frigidibacter mobilis TaxID=1335048 RepID=A0A159Z3V2_9RHOB|nr:hypothetical protein [Frigidibacter mobilis]AMY68884.1 hypothetical protein AKL17_1632 [Frigidibacter mobilis]